MKIGDRVELIQDIKNEHMSEGKILSGEKGIVKSFCSSDEEALNILFDILEKAGHKEGTTVDKKFVKKLN